MKKNITLENGCVKKLFLKFAIPSIIGMLIVSMQVMIDGIFLGQATGAVGLATVNLSMPLINTIMSIALMICIGGGVLVGISNGQKEYEKAKGLTSLTFALFLFVLILISLITLFNFEFILDILGAKGEIRKFVKPYLSILVAGSIFYNMPIFTETFVRIYGKPNLVFISGVTCFLSNVILDYIFIIKLKMGVEGASIATIFANMFGGLVLFPNVQFGKIYGSMNEIKNIFFNGSSECLTTVSGAITTYIFNIIVMKNIGILGVSALTIVFYINSIVIISLYGLSQALQPIISYNLGAKNFQKIRDVLGIAFKYGAIIGITTFIFIQLFNDSIVKIFSKDNIELTTLAKEASFIVSFAYLLSFINIISSSFFTAIEKPFESAIVALSRSIIFVLIPLFTLPLFFGNKGIWLSTPSAELLSLFISIPLTLNSLKKLKRNITN